MDVAVLSLLFSIAVNLAVFGVSIYCVILFIKLARRGIKALDLYIQEKENRIN